MKKNKLVILSASLLALAVIVIAILLMSKPNIASSISVGEAMTLAENGDIVLVDMRSDIACGKTGKPKNAIHIALQKKEKSLDYLNRVKVLLDKDGTKTLGFICNTGQTSSDFVNQFIELGVKNVTSVQGGMHLKDGWLDKKLPREACSKK